MKKTSMYAIVAVIVIVIIIAGAAAFLLMGNNGGSNATPTPTPAPTAAPSVANATSLQFTVDETTSGSAAVTYNYAVKNFNASNELIRVDIPGGSTGNYTYIIDLGAQTSKLSADNGATWTASDFATDAGTFGGNLNNYVTELANWNGHDATFTYTSGSVTNVISAIHVDPDLPASMFATS
jgi:hypothetical protein